MQTTQISSPSNYDMYTGGNFFSPRRNNSIARTFPINISQSSRIRLQAQIDLKSFSFESPCEDIKYWRPHEKLF